MYKIKVITKTGYMVFNQKAESRKAAESIVLNKLTKAGWNNLKIEAEKWQ